MHKLLFLRMTGSLFKRDGVVEKSIHLSKPVWQKSMASTFQMEQGCFDCKLRKTKQIDEKGESRKLLSPFHILNTTVAALLFAQDK